MSKSTEGRGGLIVNTASIAALSFLGGMAVYTASKHGVYGFTTSMAVICFTLINFVTLESK